MHTTASFPFQGVGGFLAAPVAGSLSDRAAAAHPDNPESRLVYSAVGALVVSPLALLAYGWSLQYTTHIAVPLVAQFFIGAGCAAWLPAIMGYGYDVRLATAWSIM